MALFYRAVNAAREVLAVEGRLVNSTSRVSRLHVVVLLLAMVAGGAAGPGGALAYSTGAQPPERFWIAETGKDLSARGVNLREFIQGLHRLATNPALYELPEKGDADARERRIDEIFMRLARDLAVGRDAPRRAQPDLFIAPASFDAGIALQQVRQGEAPSVALLKLSDHGPGYQRLLEDFRQLSQLSSAAGWPDISGEPALKPGAIGDDRTKLVANALQRLGYETEEAVDVYSAALAKSVAAFQADHGLDPDGVIGPNTASWLSTRPERRAALLRLNIERLRWFGRAGQEARVDVNIAAFRMAAFEGGALVRELPVIVGTGYRRTPQFESHFSRVVFNPPWTPTPKIIRLTLAPKFKANPELLKSMGFDVLDPSSGKIVSDVERINWSTYQKAPFPYVLRQRAGPKNALGQIKFDLPNDFAIYLHDTPDKHLFEERVRSFSSGCIRVSDPKWLASWLLGVQQSEIERLTMVKGTFAKPVERKVQVRVLYLTAWRDKDSRLQMRDDIYGRDTVLSAALDRSPGASR